MQMSCPTYPTLPKKRQQQSQRGPPEGQNYIAVGSDLTKYRFTLKTYIDF